MNIKEIKFRRVYNLGNYENIHIEIIADVLETENVQEVLKKLNDETNEYKNNFKKF